MSDIQITLFKKIDRSTINADTTIDFVNAYAPEGIAADTLKYSELSAGEQESLNVVLDKLSFDIENSAVVFTILRDGKEFDLTSSYVRDVKSTEAPLTAVTAGTALLVRFEVAGFIENTFRELSLWYDHDFDAGELTALEEIGITVTGNGAAFTIANDFQCKVSFSKPDAVTDFYIINDLGTTEIIMP